MREHFEQKKHEKQLGEERFIYANEILNEPVVVLEFIEDLNDMILTLSKLTDIGYFLDCLNNDSNVEKFLSDNGMTEKYFYELQKKIEGLLKILVGASLDNVGVRQLVNNMYRKIAQDKYDEANSNWEYRREIELALKRKGFKYQPWDQKIVKIESDDESK